MPPKPGMIACPCVNVVNPEWGILHSIEKCAGHRKEAVAAVVRDYAHFSELGAIVDGIPQHLKYTSELLEPLDAMEVVVPGSDGGDLLEIGPGLGMYTSFFLQRGYKYQAVEPCSWAAQWIRNTFLVPVFEGSFEDYVPEPRASFFPNLIRSRFPRLFEGIVAAHVIEHMVDAPGALQRIHGMLDEDGRLYMIVPDDEDPWNPEHLWFFTPDSLESTLYKVGFRDVRIATRRRIEREQFLYAWARK